MKNRLCLLYTEILIHFENLGKRRQISGRTRRRPTASIRRQIDFGLFGGKRHFFRRSQEQGKGVGRWSCAGGKIYDSFLKWFEEDLCQKLLKSYLHFSTIYPFWHKLVSKLIYCICLFEIYSNLDFQALKDSGFVDQKVHDSTKSRYTPHAEFSDRREQVVSAR